MQKNKEIVFRIGIQDVITLCFGGLLLLVSCQLYLGGVFGGGVMVFHFIVSLALISSFVNDTYTQFFILGTGCIYLGLYSRFHDFFIVPQSLVVVSFVLEIISQNMLLIVLSGVLVGMFLSVLLFNTLKYSLYSFLLIFLFSVLCTIYSCSVIFAEFFSNLEAHISTYIIISLQIYFITFLLLSLLSSLLVVISQLIHRTRSSLNSFNTRY